MLEYKDINIHDVCQNKAITCLNIQISIFMTYVRIRQSHACNHCNPPAHINQSQSMIREVRNNWQNVQKIKNMNINEAEVKETDCNSE